MKFTASNAIIRSLLSFKKKYMDGYARKSYSQEGEDLVLLRLLKGKANGFYVDVGAHHPRRFSNTFLFYKKGWRGINIDAMPGSMVIFRKERPRDINIEVPIAENEIDLIYYEFNEPALNGFSKTLSDKRDGVNGYKIIASRQIRAQRLDRILGQYLPEDQKIDFLSIDVEGFDFEVLKSITLSKYQPTYIVIEDLEFDVGSFQSSEIGQYLKINGYHFISKCVNSIIYERHNV